MKANHTDRIDKVFYSGPYWDEKEINAAVNALQYGKWLTAGEKVHHFESEFGKKFKSDYCHMVNSGSSANLVMITALKKYFHWDDQDEIIVSPVGFPTTIAPIYQNQLKPVFVDIEWNTLNFDLNLIEAKITDKTVAIFLSPVLGNPPHMDMLAQICYQYKILLILDNCDSLGSKWNGLYLNELSVAWSTSFYPAHHISTMEGGMVCTHDKKLYELFRSISCWGRDCYCVGSANLLPNGTCKRRFSKWLDDYDSDIDHKYVFTNIGYNLKPLDLQGAIGLEQLKKFDEIEKKRKANFNFIANAFSEILGIRTVKKWTEADTCWFGIPLITDNKKEIVRLLEKGGIQTRNYFAGNILLHPAYKFMDDFNKYPEANKVLDIVFFVGCAPHYRQEHFDLILKVLYSIKS